MVYGTGMLDPTVIKFGSDKQKQEILPRIKNAGDFWYQGFSEPGSRFDLASLKCKARLEKDYYVINGSKMWTSEGHSTDRMFGLFRTDSTGKKQFGITFLLLDMNAPGVEVHPIKTFDGSGPEINQIFFKDVQVPTADRLGDEHQRWALAKYLLSLERFGTAEISRSTRTLQKLKLFACEHQIRGQRLIEDHEFRTRLTRCEIDLRRLN